MVLTLPQHGDRAGHEAPLVEILDRRQPADPFSTLVAGRIHAGEGRQDPHHFAKVELRFRSGQGLPRCWSYPDDRR